MSFPQGDCYTREVLWRDSEGVGRYQEINEKLNPLIHLTIIDFKQVNNITPAILSNHDFYIHSSSSRMSYNLNHFYLTQMQTNEQYKTLLDMGCSPILSEAAILKTKSQDLSALIDWISDNSEKEQEWAEWIKNNKESSENNNPVAEETQSIDHLINKQFAQELITKGHSKNVAQKALLFTQSMSIKAAENWIEQHKYDMDFQEEVFITGQQQNQPKLTPEEAKAKLKELTQKARAIKKKRQEEDALERQKNRLKSGKEMMEAKRQLDEAALKRKLQLDRIQKEKDEAYKKQLLQQMRRERNEKLGKKQVEAVTTATGPKKEKIQYTKVQQVEIQCEQVKVGNHAYPDKAKTFFDTAGIYVTNIIKNNGEQKFRKINKENKAFQSRITQSFGGVQTLQVIGYQQDGGFLFMRNYEIKELQNILKVLQRYSSYYN